MTGCIREKQTTCVKDGVEFESAHLANVEMASREAKQVRVGEALCKAPAILQGCYFVVLASHNQCWTAQLRQPLPAIVAAPCLQLRLLGEHIRTLFGAILVRTNRKYLDCH